MIITVAYTRPLVSGYRCVGLRYCESVLSISPLLLRECSYHRYRAFPASAQTIISESSGDLQETGPTDTFLYFVSRHHTNHQNCNHDYLSAYDSASTDSKRIHHFLLLVVLRVPVWASRPPPWLVVGGGRACGHHRNGMAPTAVRQPTAGRSGSWPASRRSPGRRPTGGRWPRPGRPWPCRP